MTGTEATFTEKDKKAFHEFKAGSITVFDCAQDCLRVSFVRENQVIATKIPPGHIENVPGDVTIVVNGGMHGGSARGS